MLPLVEQQQELEGERDEREVRSSAFLPFSFASTLTNLYRSPAVVALYDYTPQSGDELELREGEEAELVETGADAGEGWTQVRPTLLLPLRPFPTEYWTRREGRCGR